MDYKQIFIEGCSAEELSDIISVFTNFVSQLMKDTPTPVNNVIEVTEEDLESLHMYLKKRIISDLRKKEVLPAYDDSVMLDPTSEGYKESIKAVENVLKETLILVVSKHTNYKWISPINADQATASRITIPDDKLMIAFCNTARHIKKYDMSLHIPSEEDESKMSAIDFHFSKDMNEISFTSCQLGAPIIEVYVGATISGEIQEDGTKTEDKKGIHVMRIPYGDPGSMYHDILVQLSGFREFESIQICIRRFQQDNPQLIDVNGLEDLKNKVFALQSTMNWYGVIESSNNKK